LPHSVDQSLRVLPHQIWLTTQEKKNRHRQRTT
jgi:hypothetical protein